MISSYRLYSLLATGLFVFCSCGRKPNLEKERQTLLLLHTQQQAAHLNKNAKQLVHQFADNMLSVDRGKISITIKDSAEKKFQHYFENVLFKKWEDLQPPVIEFSADASMAYMLVDKLVVLMYTNAENKNIEETTHFAWVSIFKKQAGGQWKIVCNISTNEPETTKVLHD
jgi:ketosteroid isomerase-like protein